MRQLAYALRFTGRALPTGPDGSVLAPTATAPGASIATTGGSIAHLDLVTEMGATFESEVTVTGVTSFQEIGTIIFGDDRRLRFATLGSGHFDSSPMGRRGAAVWQIEAGEGQFAGARGFITAQILLADDLTVTSFHLGVIFWR